MLGWKRKSTLVSLIPIESLGSIESSNYNFGSGVRQVETED